MSCARYRQLLSRYVDGEVTPRQRQELLAHVQTCHECATWLAKARQTDNLLKKLPEKGPSDHVRSAILSSVQHHADAPAPAIRRPRTQVHHPMPHVGGLRSSAAGLLLRFDPSTRKVVLAAAASLVAMMSLAYWTGVLPPLNGYNKLGFEFPNDESHTIVSSTPLSAVSLGENGVGGPVAAPNPVRVLPTEETSGVPISSALSVRFDQPMDRSSVEAAMLVQPPVAGAFSWTADNEVSFVPAQPGLLRGVTYSAILSNTARSLAGTKLQKPVNWAFHTHEPHEVVPELSPHAQVPLTSTFGIAFDVPMNKVASADKIGLYAENTGELLPTSLTWDKDGRNVIILPSTPLPEGAVSLRIGESALAANSETLGRAYEFTYTAAPPASSLRIKQGRIRIVQAGRPAAIEYTGVANGIDAPPAHVTVGVYRLGAERLLTLDVQAHQWPAQLPIGFISSLERSKTFRSMSPEESAGDPVVIEGLSPGIYLLQAEAPTQGGALTDWQLFIVADRNLAEAKGVGPSALWATSGEGQAWGGAEISLYAPDGKLLDKGSSAHNGLWQPASAKGATLAIAQDTLGHVAAAILKPTDKPANVQPDTLPASIQTDRPSYLPGQMVNFRVLVQTPAELAPATPSVDQAVTVQLRTPEDALLSTLTLRPDNVGGVGGQFPISRQARPGTYVLQVRVANAQRSFPIEVASAPSNGLSIYIVPAQEYTASESLLITRTVSVLGEGGTPAAGVEVTATLGIQGDTWLSEPVTATANPDGRATFTLPLPAWISAYNDPGLYVDVTANLADQTGSSRQYLDFTPPSAQLGLPQIVAPSMDIAATERNRQDGSVAVRIVELGAESAVTTGNVLVAAVAPSGERSVQVVDLAAAGGDVTLKLSSHFAGGFVSIMRGTHSESREMLLMPPHSSDVTLNIQGPDTVQAGAPLPLGLVLQNEEGQGMLGIASMWMRPVAGSRVSTQAPGWISGIDLQASTPATTTLNAPLEPGLWYIMAQAATSEGVYESTWSVVRVTPGLSLQLPPLKQVEVGKPQSVAVVLHNPSKVDAPATMRIPAEAGIAVLGVQVQEATVDAGGSRRFIWQYSAEKAGRLALQFEVASVGAGTTARNAWSLPIEVTSSDLENTTYAAGMLTGERDISVLVPSGLKDSGAQLEIRAATSLLPMLANIAIELPIQSSSEAVDADAAAARWASLPVVNSAYRRVEGESNSDLEQSANARSMLLQAIYSTQNRDGGWGAGNDAPSDIDTTGHVLLAMRRAEIARGNAKDEQKQQASIDGTALNRGLKYLSVQTGRAVSDNPSAAELNRQAYGMYVLSMYGLLQAEQARPLMQYAASDGTQRAMTVEGQAWLALALLQAGDRGDTLAILDRIVPNQAEQNKDALAPMLELSLATSAAVSKAAPGSGEVRSKQDAALYEGMAGEYAKALVSARQGIGWSNAAATGDALWSLSLYATQEDIHVKHGTAEIVINDHPVQVAQPPLDGHAAVTGGSSDTVSVLLTGDTLHAGANLLKLKASAPDNSLYYSLTLKASK